MGGLSKEQLFASIEKTKNYIDTTIQNTLDRSPSNGKTDYFIKYADYDTVQASGDTFPVSGMSINALQYLPDSIGNLEVTSNHYVKLKRNKVYTVKASLFVRSASITEYYIRDNYGNTHGAKGYVKSIDTNVVDSHAYAIIETPDDKDLEISMIIWKLNSGSTLTNTLTYFVAEEIGSKEIVDSLIYTDEEIKESIDSVLYPTTGQEVAS